mmetsp:Transcript_27767/g.73377  ORF Transcript_27767/g.73377 Transcript_27767/m.73377 type:complete len:202 (+) Transcript_27767:578-1183(+)
MSPWVSCFLLNVAIFDTILALTIMTRSMVAKPPRKEGPTSSPRPARAPMMITGAKKTWERMGVEERICSVSLATIWLSIPAPLGIWDSPMLERCRVLTYTAPIIAPRTFSDAFRRHIWQWLLHRASASSVKPRRKQMRTPAPCSQRRSSYAPLKGPRRRPPSPTTSQAPPWRSSMVRRIGNSRTGPRSFITVETPWRQMPR